MSLSHIVETDTALVSGIDNYENWKTRKIIGIRTESNPKQWFYSAHYGWWEDKEELFEKQWERTIEHMADKFYIWLMGDFNNPSQVQNEGYDLMMKSGYSDSFTVAKQKDNGITVCKSIDGWKDKSMHEEGMRIDLIINNFNAEINSSKVIFNGENYPVVSDHFGVIVDYEGEIQK